MHNVADWMNLQFFQCVFLYAHKMYTDVCRPTSCQADSHLTTRKRSSCINAEWPWENTPEHKRQMWREMLGTSDKSVKEEEHLVNRPTTYTVKNNGTEKELNDFRPDFFFFFFCFRQSQNTVTFYWFYTENSDCRTPNKWKHQIVAATMRNSQLSTTGFRSCSGSGVNLDNLVWFKNVLRNSNFDFQKEFFFFFLFGMYTDLYNTLSRLTNIHSWMEHFRYLLLIRKSVSGEVICRPSCRKTPDLCS